MFKRAEITIACATLLGISLTQNVFATAPMDQMVPNASITNGGSNLYSIVDFMNAVNAGGDYGTGSIVYKGTTPALGGGQIGVVDILTADHVASVNNYASFIGLGAVNGIIAPNVYPDTLLAARGINGTEDLTLVQAQIGNITNSPAAATVYNNITPLQIANPGPTGPGAGRATQVGASFTEYGYGDTGTAYTLAAQFGTYPAGTQGYVDSGSSFTMRFQNNIVATVNTGGPAAYTRSGNYVEPLLTWKFVAPANNAFTGMSFGGDSGGPYLTSYPSNFTINRGGNMVTGGVLTDFIDAVHVTGTSAGTVGGQILELNGDSGAGVYIDQYNAAWINNVVTGAIPEPASASLIITVAIGALARRRRRAC